MADISLEEFLANSRDGLGTIIGMKKPAEGEDVPNPPTVEKLVVEHPTYRPVPFDSSRDEKWLEFLKFGAFQFDRHCPLCGERTTWRTMSDTSTAPVEKIKATYPGQEFAKRQVEKLTLATGYFARHLSCTRRGHLMSVYFLQGPWGVVKVGQYPSTEDIAAGDLEKYRQLLGRADFKELHRAGGLFSHGVGVGSWVYLRRIFERLIQKTRTRVDPDGTLFPTFERSRMDEKIDLLKEHLPEPVVRNRATYKILSKGIHELEEEECLAYFPPVRSAIVVMLERDYEADERRRVEKSIEDDIATLNQKLQQTSDDS